MCIRDRYSGFPEESFDTVFIILDKMDKIGLEGVAEELEKEGFSKESIDTYLGMFKEITSDIEGVRYCKEKLSDVLDPKVAEDLETIITAVDSVKNADFRISFDPTLVRGMSYYTGPIFEIAMDAVSYTHLKPLFAQKGLRVLNLRILGKNQNVAKMKLEDMGGTRIDAVYFGEADEFAAFVQKQETISVTYYPEINVYPVSYTHLYHGIQYALFQSVWNFRKQYLGWRRN